MIVSKGKRSCKGSFQCRVRQYILASSRSPGEGDPEEVSSRSTQLGKEDFYGLSSFRGIALEQRGCALLTSCVSKSNIEAFN